MGEPETVYEHMPFAPNITQLYYFGSELRLDLSMEDKLEFIEILGGPDGELKPEICGFPVFSSAADDVLRALSETETAGIIDNENGYGYSFIGLSVGLYRPALPEDIEAMISDAEETGEPLSDEEIDYEMKRANHWATVGIGGEGYYSGLE